MSLPDPAASAALSGNIDPVYFAFLDFVGEPVRANTSGANVTPVGTGVPGLDGFEFLGISGQFINLSPNVAADGGSRSITATLSGIPAHVVDAEIIAIVDDPTKWRSRDADVWQLIRDDDKITHGTVRLWCGGKIVALNHGGGVDGLRITVHIEGYLAALSEASNRTYLDQELFDPTDLSGRASIALANGNYSGNIVNPPPQYVYGQDPWAGGGYPIGGI